MSQGVEGGFKDKGQGVIDLCRAVSVGQIPCPLFWPLRVATRDAYRYEITDDGLESSKENPKRLLSCFFLKDQGENPLPEASFWKDTNGQDQDASGGGQKATRSTP